MHVNNAPAARSNVLKNAGAPAFLRTLLLAAGALLTCMLLASAYVVLRSAGRRSGRFTGLGTIMGAAPSFVVGLFVMLVVNQVVYYYWNPEIYVPPRWWPPSRRHIYFRVPVVINHLVDDQHNEESNHE